jgi:hypothetical protein
MRVIGSFQRAEQLEFHRYQRIWGAAMRMMFNGWPRIGSGALRADLCIAETLDRPSDRSLLALRFAINGNLPSRARYTPKNTQSLISVV